MDGVYVGLENLSCGSLCLKWRCGLISILSLPRQLLAKKSFGVGGESLALIDVPKRFRQRPDDSVVGFPTSGLFRANNKKYHPNGIYIPRHIPPYRKTEVYASRRIDKPLELNWVNQRNSDCMATPLKLDLDPTHPKWAIWSCIVAR
jgi:hypothetical protein